MMGERMKGERGVLAAAEAAEERSDEAGSAAAVPRPDPEVEAKPKRRTFTAAYRLRILEEADRCQSPGEVGLHQPAPGGSTERRCSLNSIGECLKVVGRFRRSDFRGAGHGLQ